MIKIEAKSSKELVYVAIDGQKVYENAATDDSGRGIHVVVLNQNTGVVMATRRFDTYYAKEDELLILFCNLLQEGRIVIFVIKVWQQIQQIWEQRTLKVLFTRLLILSFRLDYNMQ